MFTKRKPWGVKPTTRSPCLEYLLATVLQPRRHLGVLAMSVRHKLGPQSGIIVHGCQRQ
jgi:hypothetical protein